MIRDGTRVLVYDRTDPRLSTTWAAGAAIFRALRKFDHVVPFTTAEEALDGIASAQGDVSEVQWWGHGSPGALYAKGHAIFAQDLANKPALRKRVDVVVDKLTPNALVWFRVCSLFHGAIGHATARQLADLFGCRVASSTFIIGPWHSGQHSLRPGESPSWPADEGGAAVYSLPWRPNTISFLQQTLPKGW